MASIGSCLKETFKIVFFLTIYLILEVSVLAAVLVTSVILTTWVTRSGLYIYTLDRNPDAVDHNIFELVKAVMVSWFIFVITLQWTRYWQPLTIPSKLQEFQRKSHPRLCAVLRNITVPLLILVCTCCQICSFFSKFYRTRPVKVPTRHVPKVVQEEADDGFVDQFVDRNDRALLGSMWLLVYLSVRVFRFYKHVETTKVVKEVGWEQAQCPTWRAYFQYFYTSLAYELFLTDVCILVYLGIGVILQDDNKLFCWFPYIFTCLISVGFGIVIGDVEERLPWLNNKLGLQPYCRTIHWDARSYLLSLFLIPLLSFSYFRSPTDFKDNLKDKLLHNLLHMAFVANMWMCITKGQTLFSYVIRGHYWRNRRHSRINNPENGRGRQSSNNRVFPQLNRIATVGNSGAQCQSVVVVDHNGNSVDKLGIAAIMKKVYLDYFPLHVTKNETMAGDQGSVSTGTCTSLLNRQTVIGNVEAVAAVVLEGPQLVEEGLPTPPLENSRTPPGNDVECGRGEQELLVVGNEK